MNRTADRNVALAALLGPFVLLAVQKLFIILALAYWIAR